MSVQGVRYDAGGSQPRTRIARIHRGGNSLGVYVPKLMADQLGLAACSEVRVYIVNGVLCIEPVKREDWIPAVVAAAGEGVEGGR